MGYKRYERYKDSGVDWIGEVPEGWEVNRLKNSIKSCKNGIWGKEPEGNHNDIPCIRVADFDRNNLVVDINDITYRNYSENKQREYLLNVGDLLIEKSGGGEKQLVGFVVSYNHQLPAVYSNFIARMELKKNLAYQGYFKYVHAAMYSVRLNLRSIKQTTGIQNLDTGYYFEEIVPYPLLTEQKNIADFLNQKTAEIDSLIADKKKMVQLLQEMRQAIISEAITKGLDKNVKMKDSGVEWIGEIPEHWEVKKVKYLTSIISKGTTPSTVGKNTFEKGEVRYLKAENIKDNTLYYEPEFFIDQETHNLLKRSQLKENDILFVIAGATIGKVAILRKHFLPANTNQAVSFIRINRLGNSGFTWYWLQTSKIRKLIWLSAVQSAQPNLSMEDLGNLPILYPPLDEQCSICSYLNKKTFEIDSLISNIQTQINKLHEYRQSLISEAVTGKIDVRDIGQSTEGGVQNDCNAG